MSPYITFVFPNRNDNYAGVQSERIQLFIDYYAHYAARWPDLFEFFIVDYNPPSDRPPLREGFDWSPLGRVVHAEVPPEVHQAVPGVTIRKMQDYIARNVGLRYGTAPYGAIANQDVFISRSILEELARRELKPEYFYRGDRCDFILQAAHGEGAEAFEKMAEKCTFVVHRRHATRYTGIAAEVKDGNLLDCGSLPEPGDSLDVRKALIYCHGSRKFLRVAQKAMQMVPVDPEIEKGYNGNAFYGNLCLHTNAAGDFAIATREAWEKIHGFPEDPGFYMHTDAYGIFQLFAAGYEQALFMQPHRVYHADHARAERVGLNEPDYEEHEKIFNAIAKGERSYCVNDANWALYDYPLRFWGHPDPSRLSPRAVIMG